MKTFLTILGCGSSMGVPRADGFWGSCDKNNKKNYRTRSSALISRGNNNILIDTFNILKDFSSKNPKILMHCFTGSSNFSKKLLDLGAYISLSGIITFKKSIKLQETASSIPIDRLLIETDSPFLAPEPKRGSTNEPSFIKYTAQKLAEIKNISYDDLIVYTSNNFIKLFSINL